MNKLTLNTIEKTTNYTFNKANIFTQNYKNKLNKSELHTPNAAKIIIEDQATISSFILLQPLINVNSDGDITIHTPSTFDQATLMVKYRENAGELKDIKRDIKILKNKLEFGISIKEMINMNYSQAKLEAIMLEEKIENIYKGGGF